MASNPNASKKLPKGEFPSNIHILKGAIGGEINAARGANGDFKGGPSGNKNKSEKLFGDMKLDALPKFKDVPNGHRIELFKAKLKAC